MDVTDGGRVRVRVLGALEVTGAIDHVGEAIKDVTNGNRDAELVAIIWTSSVVGGIGAGALTRLNQLGISVHRAQAATVRENVSLYTAKNLQTLTVQGCCGGHSHDGKCAH